MNNKTINFFNQNINKYIGIIIFLLLLSTSSIAQTVTPKENPTSLQHEIIIIGFLIAVLVMFCVLIFSSNKDGITEITELKIQDLTSNKFTTTNSTSLSNQADNLIQHEYDGIQELDNRVPSWLTYLFYTSLVFAIIYLLYFHVFSSGKLSIDEYTEEVLTAQNQKQNLNETGSSINEENVILLTDNNEINQGKEIFTKYCTACHGNSGEGGVGPNLTDEYWIHGGSIKNIFKIIKVGVSDKGMLSWQQQLKPEQIQQVTSYILSIKGTNPPNSKAPQGEKYIEENTIKFDENKSDTKDSTDTNKESSQRTKNEKERK